MTVEHLVPASAGGAYCLENLACSCYECNTVRSCLFLHDLKRADGKDKEIVIMPSPDRPAVKRPRMFAPVDPNLTGPMGAINRVVRGVGYES